jgi:cyclic pyranopterin monophosphate synthase
MSFTHLDEKGTPGMVDVGAKASTRREATAQSLVVLPQVVWAQFRDEQELQTKKGPVLQTAIIAGTMAVKQTSQLIPLCHPLPIEKIHFQLELQEPRTINIRCTVSMTGKTGVEMEALTGASVAALTIYDMCKAFSQDIVIQETKLMAKSGGKTDFAREA